MDQPTKHHWFQSVTEVKPNELRLRGYLIDEMMGHVNFADGIWLALMGELPTTDESKLINAILLSSIDHGATPPSALTCRTVASTGAPINAAVAAGVLAINKFHGGAIETCMHSLLEGVKIMDNEQKDAPTVAKDLIKKSKDSGKRLSGFGHRVHTCDPRTVKLFQLAEQANKNGAFVQLAKALEAEFAAQGKPLPINVDGAIAAVLCEMGLPSNLANGFFIMARVVGMIAHFAEEVGREKPMRVVHPTDHEYDGTPPRTFNPEVF